MNEKLFELYSSKWKEFYPAIKSIYENDNFNKKPTNPLLLYIDNEDNWQNADIRVMFFGQETYDWGKFNTNLDLEDENSIHKQIDHILNSYKEFFTYGEYQNYGGYFWRSIEHIVKQCLMATYLDQMAVVKHKWILTPTELRKQLRQKRSNSKLVFQQ